MTRLCDGIVRWGLVALIVFTPFAFGTVEAWSTAIMEWGIWAIVVVAAVGGLWSGTLRAQILGTTGMEIPVALFIGFCLFQTVPLPASWLGRLSPGSARVYQGASIASESPVAIPPAMAETDPLLRPAPAGFRPLSVDPGLTRERIVLLASFAAAFFLVARWAIEPGRIFLLLASIGVTGFAVALFALVQFLTWNGRIYWFRRIPTTSAFGPFVNHNHFAGYVGMIIPVALTFAFFFMEGRTTGGDQAVSDRWGRTGLALFAAVLLVVSLFLSVSRGGILSTVAGGIVLFALVSRRLESRAITWAVAIGLIVVILGFIAWIGADVVSQGVGTYGTIEKEASFQLRVVVWQAMIRHLPDYLWFGSGLGTFEESFPFYTPPGSARRWDRAHNDYLQLTWETGLVGAALFLFAAGVFVWRYWRPSLKSRQHPMTLFRIGVAVSILTIALHSLVDFNLQIGSNGFLFALLCGALVALNTPPRSTPNRPGHATAAGGETPPE